MAKFVDIQTEYAKDKNLKKEDVETIQNWVSHQPHLPKINELQAIAFLKKNLYHIEPTKKTIDTYFTLRNLWSDLFLGRDFSKPPLKGIFDVVTFIPLPKKTPEGFTLIFMKILSPEIVHYDLSQVAKYLDMTIMSHLYQHGTSEGHLLLADIKNLSDAYLPKLDFLTFKRYFYFMQEAMPVHPKGLHYVASCSFMEEAMDVVRSAAPKAMLPFIQVHNSVEDIGKFIPIELLPVDYGGSEDSVDVLKEKWERNLLANAPLFEWEDQQVVKEEKRPSKAKGIFDIENGFSAVY